MHIVMVIGAIAISVLLRSTQIPATLPWPQRWTRTLGAFTLPPVLLLTTALAIALMGPNGMMLGMTVGGVGYGFSVLLLGGAFGWLLVLMVQGMRAKAAAQTYPLITLGTVQARLLKMPDCFAGHVGLWPSELVISEGLIERLTAEQLQGVLAHEQAHRYYQDTLWFWILGWLRRLTGWLPRTEALWQELLLLRELRADHWAATQVDPLTLAEALLVVVRSPFIPPAAQVIPLHDQPTRVETRINALLAADLPSEERLGQLLAEQQNRWLIGGLVALLVPLLLMALHH
ncbi:M48 family metalloprotease [Spirulina major CS-329]|uniref:M56 family metallopeptidase n=1 Tax=Spirulina TaxID=1154 RepID=UPI00232CB1DD|nr:MULTISPECIES: M56 family metallopeptidase [Spirulina]MDB9497056.1 M48 family metalloprotease [Spirulina subsalsa CS-330]MDB9501656.1 M48 family metalloprotease [Spirulina major CS-329]